MSPGDRVPPAGGGYQTTRRNSKVIGSTGAGSGHMFDAIADLKTIHKKKMKRIQSLYGCENALPSNGSS